MTRRKSSPKNRGRAPVRAAAENFEVPWKTFQDLVARIRATQEPQGAVVRSPDLVLCDVTEIEREVDASIRRPTSDGGAFVSLEARRRVHKEDVLWIEQLATKMRNLKLDETIAISSAGFTQAAIKLALHEGITLATVKELEEGALPWLQLQFATLRVSTWVFEGFDDVLLSPIEGLADDTEISIVRDDEGLTTTPGGALNYPFFSRSDGQGVSPNALYALAQRQGFKPFDGFGVGESETRVIPFKFEADELFVQTNLGKICVRQFSMRYRIRIEDRPMKRTATFRSLDAAEKGNLEGVEFSLGETLKDTRFIFQKDLSGGGYRFSFVQSVKGPTTATEQRRSRNVSNSR